MAWKREITGSNLESERVRVEVAPTANRQPVSYSLGDRMDVVEETVKLPFPSPSNAVIVPSLRFETARSK